jgi:type II secretory pathway pseudopilin PulG
MKAIHRLRRRRQGKPTGFTIVEVAFAVAIVVVALLTTIGSIASSMRVTRTVTEREAATRAAVAKLSEIVATTFDKIVIQYDADPSNDQNGAATAPGADFDATGFTPPKGDQHVGIVTLPLSGGQLREDVNIPELGMPRDLNGDGVVDAKNHITDYKLLPILVELRWDGIDGVGSVKIPKLLSSK